KYSDILVITSDNPRWEEPQEIINHILEGVNSNIPTVVEVDRRKAIKRAILEISQEGDIIVIAGKGHEDYQEIKGVKYPFSDRQEVLKLKEETQDWL
ncbi:MAG: UDP-N-acetylmuramoyl-L-alanyl-D-glutamate--2,6-diaminopimelate ligase, partial [Aquificota bacterium]